MRQLGIAAVIVAVMAVNAPLTFHALDPSRPIPERGGAAPLGAQIPAASAPTAPAPPAAAATPALSGVALGQPVSTTAGCATCHSVDGTRIIGPTWNGLAGSQIRFTDGTTVTADDSYLRESIVNPDLRIVDGYTDDMPASLAAALSNDQIPALVAYIQTLQ